jgi:hypothetical protein
METTGGHYKAGPDNLQPAGSCSPGIIIRRVNKIDQQILTLLLRSLETIGLNEEELMGIFYADRKSAEGFSPEPIVLRNLF